MNLLRDIMTENVATVSPSQTVQDAARLMSDYNVGSIPVVDQGRVIGIITDRDITLRSTAQGLTSTTAVSEVMSSHVIWGTPEMNVEEAASLMAEKQIRRLPIVEHDQLIGVIALGDIATNEMFDEEAEAALTNISIPSQPEV
ncbi:CBS domain-containing protein [Bacillus mesophilus]|uniref:CBS domain-containing protein n=1 Tax=Bacillus mesophilus TaxID=1808955 RepID=A0A6M0QD72_9BACI|nr:CBS domain-containing protein [Bacillus mesophilus]MBM7660064.1 CBS domain-containing protein [Bacillus mesophilus]NEY73719.1 CBS domain-containing protein [Bacillus mesophilus]